MAEWQPSASILQLQRRAEMLRNIREFFYARDVMEVDTPVMSHCAVSDPFIDSIEVAYQEHVGSDTKTMYLQTSPEYAMKRLLAAGSGSIYQLSKVFRNGEYGRRHNPEFTMLEWYRLDMDDQQLMDEVEQLVSPILNLNNISRMTYAELFQNYLDLCPYNASLDQLVAATKHHIEIELEDNDRDTWLNLLMSHVIEPKLASEGAVFVTEYPASQAALAKVKINDEGIKVASRFELFINGMELANGYHELTDSSEQSRRLKADQQQRIDLGLPERPLDMRLVDALEHGMPACAGVALGFDRLLALSESTDCLADILPFDHSRA